MTKNEVLELVQFHAELRGLSKSTQVEYVVKAKAFQNHFNQPATELGLEHVKQFLHYLFTERKLGSGSVNTYISGLRFLFQIALDQPLDTTKIPCHRKRRPFPDILTRKEITTLLDVTPNLRDKAILSIMYGSGLRISEVISLRVSDIDSANMQLLIRNAKGGKDRYAILPEMGGLLQATIP